MHRGDQPAINIGRPTGAATDDYEDTSNEYSRRNWCYDRDKELKARMCETYSRMPYRSKNFNSTKRLKSNGFKFLKQILISLLIFLGILGLQNLNFPLAEKAKGGVRYLLTTETEFAPVFQKVVQTAMQWSNVDWPIIPSGQTVSLPVITELKGGLGLEMPVGGRVQLPYGWVLDSSSQLFVFHGGIDIEAKVGTEVKAGESGEVLRVGTDETGNQSVLIRHSDTYMTRYENLADVTVEVAQPVEAGTVIGKVSGAGLLKNHHVHFEVLKHGIPIDPLTVLYLTSSGK